MRNYIQGLTVISFMAYEAMAKLDLAVCQKCFNEFGAGYEEVNQCLKDNSQSGCVEEPAPLASSMVVLQEAVGAWALVASSSISFTSTIRV